MDATVTSRVLYMSRRVEVLSIGEVARRTGMSVQALRCYEREGPGNEQERLELLREQKRSVENQLDELGECLRIISRKVGVYEQHLADGTAQDLYTAKA